MAKDYAKLKALAQQIVECIGDDCEGEDPSLPKQDNDLGGNGQEANTTFLSSTGDKNAKESVEGSGDSKKKKESSLAMMGSMLASKLKK